MWLLTLHLSISILLFITFHGFCRVYKEKIKENGWLNDQQLKSKRTRNLIFFVPIMNLIAAYSAFIMISMTKEEFEEKTKEEKEI